MLSLINIHTKVFNTHLEVRSLTFVSHDCQSHYWGKHIVLAHWSIVYDRLNKPASNPCWDVFAKVLLAN